MYLNFSLPHTQVNVGNIYNAYVARYMKNTVGAASNSNWRTNFVENYNFIQNYTSFYSESSNTLSVQGSFAGPAFTMGITKFMHLSNDEYRVATGIKAFYQYYHRQAVHTVVHLHIVHT